MKKAILWAVLLAVGFAVAGCATEQVIDINRRLTSLDLVSKKPPDATYVVDPPDAISIEFLNEPGANRAARLRQDGTITLPYLEDVKVSGLTTVEIREKLETLYAKYYKEPRLLVSVTAFNSKHIYVYGEVGRRGSIPYTGSQTVSDVIGEVGGFTPRAAPWRVKVIRGDPKDPEVFKVNLKKLIYQGDTSQDISLAENDVLYVPPNVLSWIGYQIDNLLFPFRSIWAAVGSARQVSAISEGF